MVSFHSGSILVLRQDTGNTDSLDSPRPGLGGSHHLPPYSILCVRPLDLHPNGFLSRDSQGRVPKLFRFGLPRLWELITPNSNLRLGWGMKQTCSSPQELSNNVLHSTCTHRDRVDSWLLVVESQIANLTLDPSFDHNLCCRCPNGSCKAILDIYTSRPFQLYKKHIDARCFDPWNQALSFWESRRIPSSHFWECEFILTLASKWGCDSLDGRNVHVSCIFMWLPLRFGATYYFLQLKFYATCLRWLEQIVVTCGIYN